MAALYPLLKTQRQLAAPHGIPVSTLFFGHDPALKDYKEANKIKTVEVHPVLPWVVTADEVGNVTIWDHHSESIVASFAADSIKESQRSAVQTLEAHAAVANALDVAVPDIAGPGLGLGLGSDPGATSGSTTETFVAAVVGGISKKRVATAGLPDDARTGKTGAVRAVRFADEHCIAWYCGRGRGDYDGMDVHGNVAQPVRGTVPAMAASIDELCSTLSYAADNAGAMSSRPGAQAAPVPPPPQHWVLILCEHRVLVWNYSTRAVIDIPHSSLLIEATGPTGQQRVTTRGRPGVLSAALLGPGVIAFGCEDGAIRIWAADASAVIQTVRLGAASTKAITHLHAACTCPHAVPGTTAGISPISALGALHKDSRCLLVSGAADGVVSVWEIIGGRMLIDNGRGGLQQLRIPGELTDLTVGAITMHAVALGADKSVTVWDTASRLAQAGAAPRVALSRIVTSSTAAEGGVGSRLMAAVAMGSHPFLPPNTLLVAGKGPHLELAIAGSVEKGPGAESGIVFYDLRTARPGLPNKLKVYTLSRHPFKPEIVAAGTNIGIFVLAIAPQYTVAAACASHPAWRIPRALTDDVSAEGARVREGSVVVHVNVQGMLVASSVHVATPACEEDEVAGIAPACPLPRGPGGVLPRMAGNKAAAMGHLGLDLSSEDRVLLTTLAPTMPISSYMAPLPANKDKDGGSAMPAHNALAQLATAMKGSPVPGTRGVRLRVSGSGRYIAAVWPEHKYYAIYKIVIPSAGDAKGKAGASAPPSRQASRRHTEDGDDADHDAQSADDARDAEGAPASGPESALWTAEYVDGGPGLDVAWSGHTIGSFEDKHAIPGPQGGDKAKDKEKATPGPHASRFDRFVVLEPGQQLSGRGPMGGGMAIGSAPSKPGAEKGGAGGDSKQSKVQDPAKVPTTPATLSLRQLPVYDDPSVDPGKVTIISPDLALPQGLEPTGIAGGGPLLAMCLVPELGHSSIYPAQPLVQSSLQFFSWTVIDPDPAAIAEAEKAGAESRYSGAAKVKGARHKLVAAGGGSGMPCPSLHALASGCGVLWNGEGTRFAVLTPFNVHVMAHFSPRRIMASALKQSDAKPQHGTVLELCRVPLQAVSAAWHGASLFVSTTDARVMAVCPPAVDPHVIAEIALSASSGSGASTASASSLGLSGTVGGQLIVNGSRLSPVVVELQGLAQSPALPSAISPTALPNAVRGMAHVSCCAPLFLARGHLVTMHWTGARSAPGGASAGLGPSAAGAGAGGVQVVALGNVGHPGLRACMAASWAGSSDYRSSTGSFLQASGWAAQWGARLPDGTHTSLARHLADLGCMPAALMLPGLAPAAGVSLALSKRADVYVRVNARSTGRGWSAVETRVAVAYLLRLLETTDDVTLKSLAGPVTLLGPAPDDVLGAAAVESASNVVGVWAQVGAFLSMVAASVGETAGSTSSSFDSFGGPSKGQKAAPQSDPVLDPTAIRSALVAFAHRLTSLRMTGDALLVAATLHRAGLSASQLAANTAALVGHKGSANAAGADGEAGGLEARHGPTDGVGPLASLPVSSAELILQVLKEGGLHMAEVAKAAAL